MLLVDCEDFYKTLFFIIKSLPFINRLINLSENHSDQIDQSLVFTSVQQGLENLYNLQAGLNGVLHRPNAFLIPKVWCTSRHVSVYM